MAARRASECKWCGGEGKVALRTAVLVSIQKKDDSSSRSMEEVKTLFRCEHDASHEWWTTRRRSAEPTQRPEPKSKAPKSKAVTNTRRKATAAVG